MPKLPRVSGKDLVEGLKKLGFEIARQTGSHVVLKKGGSGCVVPLHREVRTGTLHGVLKQAGVSQEELIKTL